MKVFSLKKYLKSKGMEREEIGDSSWPVECDGKKVVDGICCGYQIMDCWTEDGEEKRIIAGMFCGRSDICYWILNDEAVVGDYAVVENMSDYTLVKIIGIIETNDKYKNKFSNGANLKRVVKVIKREEIRRD